MVETTTNKQTTDSYHPIVPGGKSARDKKLGMYSNVAVTKTVNLMTS